jgi:hypothetical protein
LRTLEGKPESIDKLIGEIGNRPPHPLPRKLFLSALDQSKESFSKQITSQHSILQFLYLQWHSQEMILIAINVKISKTGRPQ